MSGKNRNAAAGRKPARSADSRIHRTSHRARSRSRPGSEFRRDKFFDARPTEQVEIRFGHRTWSIDDRRYQFQFSTELGWEIKGGKKVRMLKNPSYSGITTEFWNSCDSICGREHWTLWGTPNCGKGQPMQTMGTGHGAAPARFRKVRMGIAFSGQ